MFTRRNVLASSLASAAGACASVQEAPVDVARLAAQMQGEVITPGAPEYDRARRVNTLNRRVEAQPLAIARCASTSDVARAIAFAQRGGHDLAVRCGGHDLLGASTSNGVLIDLSLLNRIELDASSRTVRVGGGVNSGALCAAMQPHGLVVALGCDHRPGVGGVTLGGGLGWLLGKHGAACDHLLAAELVTADGRVVRASREENPDLLWALKGGGGNFGVVTEFTFAAHPVGEVVQGVIAYDAARPSEFLRFFRDFASSAGNEIDYEFYILPRPTPIAFLKVCYSGDLGHADRVLAPLLAYGPPLMHNLARGVYTGSVDPTGDLAALFAAVPPPSSPPRPDDAPGSVYSCFSTAPLTDAGAEAISAHVLNAPGARWGFGGGYFMRGAAMVGPEASAWPRHEHQISYFLGDSWRRPEDESARMAWVDSTLTVLAPHLGPTYVNFITSPEESAVRATYGANYPRLLQIKRRYDPDNVFRRNRNIRV